MKPTITYFNAAGRAEIPRLILECAGADYDFVGIEGAQWPEKKKSLNLLFGQVPHYKDGDIELVQSVAITQYLAQKHGLNGSSLVDNAKIAEVYFGLMDLNDAYSKVVFGDEAGRSARREEFIKTAIPRILVPLDALFKGRETVGQAFSYADLAVFSTFGRLLKDTDVGDAMLPYTEFARMAKKVAENPKIKAYLERDVYRK